MRKFIIAVSLLTLAACTKKSTSSTSTSSDTTFNGSYFQISYNSKSFNCKDAVVGNQHLNMLLTNSVQWSSGSTGTILQIALATGISGISTTTLYFAGNGTTGSYTQSNIAGSGYSSVLLQTNPATEFTDTSGTASITHIGSDYVQGTFNITLNTSGFSYPATGSFKIYH